MADKVVVFPDQNCMGIHNVGCIDLMHQDLLIRLFYPTDISLPNVLYPNYTKWLPSSTYAQGYINMIQSLLPSASLPSVNDFMSKRNKYDADTMH